MASNTDIRTYDTELTRDDTTGQMKLSGYGAVWNQPSLKGDFIEYISPSALSGVDLSSVLLLYAHDFNNILARVDAKTLTLKVDQKGLYFEATLPDTTLAHDVYNNIVAGNVKGVSIGFNIASGGDSWDYSDGDTIHMITQIERLNELSLTPIPAYTQTSVEVQRDYKALKNNGGKNMADKPEDKEEDKQVDPKVDQKVDPKADQKVEPDKATPADKSDDKQGADNGDAIKTLTDMVSHLTEQVEALTAVPAPVAEVVAEDDEEKDKEKPAEDAADKGDKKDMAKNLTEDSVKTEEQRDFEQFLRTGEIKRDATGFDSAAGEAVIPSQVLDVLKQPADPTQLSGLVNKVAVSAPVGKLPVMAKASAQLATAAELAENPAIANAAITPVSYDVKTYRGQLPISMEMAQDYPEISSLLATYVADVTGQTEQHAIGKVLQTATAVAATSVDDMKDAYNIGLSNYGDRVWVLSESMFAEVDKLKDGNGRYLLQDSIASATGKTFLGAPLYIVDDTVLGVKGDKKAFVGSLKSFVLEAIRNNVSVQWVRNENFENVLGVALRADFKAADTQAGKFITYTPASATPASGK
ncbi:phage major capsid protein [Lacticaseibacillus mingshuiensis]|uniref:Phage major capsid protein n=1 Tax=Lacticaseibacillus mingshuiensis TaxID=2799574 RepID=A0ABW4CFV0_9LACO|nr:phage major capsid protein [Lacticaseibacillus mingshuiensis]